MFSVENPIEKNGRRKAKIFQNKCVSSQNHRMKKEEGATVAATPTFSQRAVLFSRQAGPAAFYHELPPNSGKE
jgi:hypothetical protein